MERTLLEPAPASSDPAQDGRGGVLAVVATAAVGIAAAVVLATVDPHEPGHYPSCPFLAATGLYCPGCGALRATHDLLHGDVVGALARNPLTVLAVPYLVAAFVTWTMRRLGRPAPRSTSMPPWALWSVLALVVVFGVLRNLPGFDALSPA